MPWKPQYPGDYPTLGWQALAWMQDNLATPDSTDYKPLIFTMEQAEFVLRFYEIDPNARAGHGWRKIRRAVISRSRGWGKAMALDTLLPTPEGWTTIEYVKVGDRLFDEHGQPCTVLAKSPVWDDTDCYRVRFSDGQEFTVSGDHLWTVDEAYRKGVTLDTRTLAATVRMQGARAECRYRITSPEPLDLPEKNLPLDPYVLGYWLGDGDRDCARITTSDPEIVDEFGAAGWKCRKQERYRYGVAGLAAPLRAIGVLNNKHVPAEYRRASREQRLALVQGLMDSDGTAGLDGRCEFSVCDRRLAMDMSELLSSLGIKHSFKEGDACIRGRVVGRRYRIAFTVHNNVKMFRLDRKQSRLREYRTTRTLYRTRRIVSVEHVETVPTQCIEVDSPSHLFLAGQRMIPTHNSPMLSAIAAYEGIGDPVFDGWDANGQPIGKPWLKVRTPLIALAAATEDQVQNAWLSLMEMLDPELAPVFDHYPGLEPMLGQVNLPYRGMIKPITTSGTSAKGMRAVMTLADQTEMWTASNGGHKFMRVLLDNAAKTGGSLIESPNAFTPGENSIAETSAQAYFAMREGRSRMEKGLLYDHREADAEIDLTSRESLVAGLRWAYGDSSGHPDGCVLHDPPCPPGWVDLDTIVARVWDPDADEQGSRANFLNQITHATDGFISHLEWQAIRDDDCQLKPGDVITLGFDGSRGLVSKGKPDASALVACRVSDGFLQPLWIDEAPDNKSTWKDWEPSVIEAEAAVGYAFKTYRVAGCAMDPAAGWRSYINGWEAKYAPKMVVKRQGQHPFEFWFAGTGKQTEVEKSLIQFENAVRNHDLKHNNSLELTRHILNARRRSSAQGRLTIQKESSYSTRKIDAAVAAVLAFRARSDALAAGALTAGVRRSYKFGKL